MKGTVVTIDAMGTQKEIAKEIIESNANYLLAVKENKLNYIKMYNMSLDFLKK